jgi:predicted hydrocarbon binding protein
MDSETTLKCLSLLERTEYYDNEGEWRIAGSDCLIIGGAIIRAWAKVTEQVLGSDARVIMFKAGKNAGEQFAHSLLKQGLKSEEMTCSLEMFLMHGGWGKVWTKVDFQKQTAIVRIRNSVTTRQTKAKGPVCHIITGYVAGVLGVIFGKKLNV